MFLALTVSLALQGGSSGPDEILVRLPNGLSVTTAEYRNYLHDVIGSARLEELILDRLLERALAGRDLARVTAAVRRALADPVAEVARRHADRLRTDYGGDRELWLDTLRRMGRTEAEMRSADRIQLLRESRIAALVQLERTPDEAGLRRLFDQDFGVDGRRVAVRHVFVPFADARRRLAASPRPGAASPERVEKMTQVTAAALWKRHVAGETLEQLGAVPVRNYNYQQFGAAFADAVRAMEVGEIRGPVRSEYGYHIVQLDSRVTTEFADVRARLIEKFRTLPPTLGEQRRLKERLFEDHGVHRALRSRQGAQRSRQGTPRSRR